MRFRGDERTVAEVREGGRSTARARGLKVAADEFSHRLAARLLRTFTKPSFIMRMEVSSSRDCGPKGLCCHGRASVVLHSHQDELACQHGLHRDDALASFEEVCVRSLLIPVYSSCTPGYSFVHRALANGQQTISNSNPVINVRGQT